MRSGTARPLARMAVPAILEDYLRFGHFFEGKKVTKGICNVAKLATLCISISPTTGWSAGQIENARCVNKISAVKINLR